MTVRQNDTSEGQFEPSFVTAREIRLGPEAGEIGAPVEAICVSCKETKRKRADVHPDGPSSFKHVCHNCQKTTYWNVVRFLDETEEVDR